MRTLHQTKRRLARTPIAFLSFLLLLGSAQAAMLTADFDGAARNPGASGSLLEMIREHRGSLPAVATPKVFALNHERDLNGAPSLWGRAGWRHWEMVKALAHRVDEGAEHVYRAALGSAHHGDYWERRALSDLSTLASKAHHFHRQLEDYRQNPDSHHTRSDYNNLVWAFRNAEESLHYAHAFGHVLADFEEVSRDIRELDWYYRDGDHDDGGHDRDDDHDPGHGWPFPFPRWPR